MDKFETVIVEESIVVEATESRAVELSVLELDLVGGGSHVVGLA